mgnify:FL=1
MYGNRSLCIHACISKIKLLLMSIGKEVHDYLQIKEKRGQTSIDHICLHVQENIQDPSK